MTEFLNSDEILNNFTTHGCLVVSGEKPNLMTASWGFIGVMWNKKVAIVPIRNTRYTKEFVDKTGEFTMSIPYGKDMSGALKYCGTKSGRDTDKIKDLNLKMVKAKKVNTYVVEGCGKYFECKVLCCLPLNAVNCPDEIKNAYYGDGNFHNFYFAEIVEEY